VVKLGVEGIAVGCVQSGEHIIEIARGEVVADLDVDDWLGLRQRHGVLEVHGGLGVEGKASVVGLHVAAVDGQDDGAAANELGLEAGEEEVEIVGEPGHPRYLVDAKRVVGMQFHVVMGDVVQQPEAFWCHVLKAIDIGPVARCDPLFTPCRLCPPEISGAGWLYEVDAVYHRVFIPCRLRPPEISGPGWLDEVDAVYHRVRNAVFLDSELWFMTGPCLVVELMIVSVEQQLGVPDLGGQEDVVPVLGHSQT